MGQHWRESVVMTEMSSSRAAFNKLAGSVLSRPLPFWPFPLDNYVGGMKFVEAIHLLNTARFALWNSFRNDHLDCEEAIDLLWVRSSFWTNAVVWMNSFEDIICQT